MLQAHLNIRSCGIRIPQNTDIHHIRVERRGGIEVRDWYAILRDNPCKGRNDGFENGLDFFVTDEGPKPLSELRSMLDMAIVELSAALKDENLLHQRIRGWPYGHR